MKILFVGSLVLVLLAVLYFGYTALRAYLVVRSAPRQDMFICQKGHGPLPKSSLINFVGEDYCPICFHQRMRQAEKGLL